MARDYAKKAARKAEARRQAREAEHKKLVDQRVDEMRQALAADKSGAKVGDIWNVVRNEIQMSWLLLTVGETEGEFMAVPVDGLWDIIGTQDFPMVDSWTIPWAARCDGVTFLSAVFLEAEGDRIGYFPSTEGLALAKAMAQARNGQLNSGAQFEKVDAALSNMALHPQTHETFMERWEGVIQQTLDRQRFFRAVRLHQAPLSLN